MSRRRPLTDRFWEKVAKSDGCWLWTGSRQRNGYGFLFAGTRKEPHPERAHRVSWRIHFGEIPDGLWVLHKCDNPPCVNPEHLFLGTRTDNMRDCARKGRVTTIGHSRLTHCKRGHEFSTSNTYVDPKGARRCRTCQAGHVQKLKAARAK